MNYFAHGFQYIDQPYFLAGTAVPDWLSVLDRRVRVRRQATLPFVGDCDPLVANLAQGIVQHHDHDKWFHGLPQFNRLNWQFTRTLEELVPTLPGLQLHFLGHILVELLLDAALIERHPQRLNEYYHAVSSVDPRVVEATINRIASRPVRRVASWLERFVNERFLADYADNERLRWRLNQVMSRVRLEPIPEQVTPWLTTAREVVFRHADELTPRRD